MTRRSVWLSVVVAMLVSDWLFGSGARMSILDVLFGAALALGLHWHGNRGTVIIRVKKP